MCGRHQRVANGRSCTFRADLSLPSRRGDDGARVREHSHGNFATSALRGAYIPAQADEGGIPSCVRSLGDLTVSVSDRRMRAMHPGNHRHEGEKTGRKRQPRRLGSQSGAGSRSSQEMPAGDAQKHLRRRRNPSTAQPDHPHQRGRNARRPTLSPLPVMDLGTSARVLLLSVLGPQGQREEDRCEQGRDARGGNGDGDGARVLGRQPTVRWWGPHQVGCPGARRANPSHLTPIVVRRGDPANAGRVAASNHGNPQAARGS